VSDPRSITPWCLTVAAATLLLLFCACGGGSTTPSGPTSITPSDSQAAASQVEQTFIAAVDQMTSTICPLPPCCNINAQNFCTMAIASEIPCSGGGTVAFNGSLSGEMNFYGTGNTTGSIAFSPANCAIPTGSSLVMNGTSSLSFTSQIFFFYGGPSGVTVSGTGSIPYGPKPTGVCQASLSINAQIGPDGNHTLQSCTLTGTACGQTVNRSC
jgi:hypothetical protein